MLYGFETPCRFCNFGRSSQTLEPIRFNVLKFPWLERESYFLPNYWHKMEITSKRYRTTTTTFALKIKVTIQCSKTWKWCCWWKSIFSLQSCSILFKQVIESTYPRNCLYIIEHDCKIVKPYPMWLMLQEKHKLIHSFIPYLHLQRFSLIHDKLSF